jgi:hypothetical protein
MSKLFELSNVKSMGFEALYCGFEESMSPERLYVVWTRKVVSEREQQ